MVTLYSLISPFILVTALSVIVYVVSFEGSVLLALDFLFAVVCMASGETLCAYKLHHHQHGLGRTGVLHTL